MREAGLFFFCLRMDLGGEGWFLWLWWYGGQGVKEERRGEERVW